jgi:hypothetical protein
MALEYSFNSVVLQNTFQEKPLAVKTGRDVSGSRNPVTAVTASSEIQPYHAPPRLAEIASRTVRGAW